VTLGLPVPLARKDLSVLMVPRALLATPALLAPLVLKDLPVLMVSMGPTERAS
jgi:hypothetical protein